MDKEQQAEIYANRLKKCLLTVQISVMASITGIGGLIIFLVVSSAIGLRESDPNAFMLGVIITAIFAILAVICALATLLVAKITSTKLKKLDSPAAKTEE